MSAKNTNFAAEIILKFADMDFISVTEFAERHGLSERTVRHYCAAGKIAGAFLTGKTWSVPADAALPKKGSHTAKPSPLLLRLQEEMAAGLRGGIYHRTQIDLTYSSNHIEGSRLTHDQTRFIFETQTLDATGEPVRIDDLLETVNHFRCIDAVIARAQERLSESFIKELHGMLKTGTQGSRASWFAVGSYKRLPNEVGGRETTAPEDVAAEMKELLRSYNANRSHSLDDLLDFHVRFERIHPFQDGNGRVGRLLLFKECLRNGIIPFIITDELKMFYYRGLSEWPATPGYLRDTCLTAQDHYAALLEYFDINN